MQSRIHLFILVCLAGLVSVGSTQETSTLPEKSVSAGNAEEAIPSFPYVAEITGNDVHIRSGPGTNYYRCTKLNKTDRVEVVSSQFSWSRIVPPAGSFSWISKRYVSINPDNPAIGIVTGDNVRVYAGSDYRGPIRSERLQGKLNKEDKVELMGQEQDDYYKIVPPSFAYLWVSTKYTRPLGPVGEVPSDIKPKAVPEIDTAEVVTTNIPVQNKLLKEYYALEKQMNAERAKPLNQQDYTNIKKALLEIAGNREAGKAARYADFATRKVECFELALEVAKAVPLQDAQLQRTQQRIEKARATKLAEVKDLGGFAVMGRFQISSIYGTEPELKHYQIIDDSGKIVCFALPGGSALKMDLGRFVGRKVGLVGIIEPHPQTAGALVRFTEVVELI